MQARAQAQAEQLQRERLAGDKKSLGQDASSENAAYKLLVRPPLPSFLLQRCILSRYSTPSRKLPRLSLLAMPQAPSVPTTTTRLAPRSRLPDVSPTHLPPSCAGTGDWS